ncbi:amidase signature domain-containing protein, partial [Blastocladiella britannica]
LPSPSAKSTNETFRHWTARDFYDAYSAGTATPTTVITAVLAAIDASNAATPSLRAIIATDKQHALTAAAAATARWSAGTPLSMLDGVPIAVKDELDVAGLPLAMQGTRFINADAQGNSIGNAATDSHCIGRLRAAGAVVVGKANMAELGLEILTCNPHPRFGTARNPWDPSRHTGGSSGGSGAAVAAGLVPIAVGADGGGSVRIPASFCGVYGLKPTWARISGAPTPCLDPSTGHVGPLAASIDDVAVAYSAMACGGGQDDLDTAGLAATLPPMPSLPKFLAYKSPADLKGLRIGYYRDYAEDADPGVVGAVRGTLEWLVSEAGAVAVDITIPDLNRVRIAHNISISSEIFNMVRNKYPGALHKMTYYDQMLELVQREASLDDYLLAQRQRTLTIEHLKSLFAHHIDVLLLPTTPVVAPKISPGSMVAGTNDATTTINVMRYVQLGNLAGVPALACPVPATDDSGMMASVQIMGNWWDEDTVLTVGKAVAEYAAIQTTGSREAGGPKAAAAPKVWFDVLPSA